jgi:hypothetical protein
MFAYIIVSGALEGRFLYDTEGEALRAAEAASAQDGRAWEVRWTFVPEE